MTENRTTEASIPPGNVSEQSVRLSTGSHSRITILGPPRGTIWAKLMDREQIAPLVEMEYSIELTNEELTGTTDEEGILRHEDVILGYYFLTTEEDQTTVFSEIDPEEPAIVRLPFTEASDEVYFAKISENSRFQIGLSDDVEIETPEEQDNG